MRPALGHAIDLLRDHKKAVSVTHAKLLGEEHVSTPGAHSKEGGAGKEVPDKVSRNRSMI